MLLSQHEGSGKWTPVRCKKFQSSQLLSQLCSGEGSMVFLPQIPFLWFYLPWADKDGRFPTLALSLIFFVYICCSKKIETLSFILSVLEPWRELGTNWYLRVSSSVKSSGLVIVFVKAFLDILFFLFSAWKLNWFLAQMAQCAFLSMLSVL